MASGEVRVDPEPLKEFTRDVFIRLGVPPEDRVYQDRARNGIPLPEGTIENLRYVANRLEVDLSSLN